MLTLKKINLSNFFYICELKDTVECGQLNEEQNFNVISSTGIVTAHFLLVEFQFVR